MAYVITNTRGQTVATILTGQDNTTATDLTLIGQNYVEFGLAQNENFVYLLENFAAPTPPLQPIQGQLWFDTANNQLKLRLDVNTWSALADQSYVQAQKISPAFTGVPTAPTATAGTNTTQLATTAFVTTAVAAIDLSPYARLDGATFTGNVFAPTAALGTVNTQVATTAFARNLFDDINTSLYVPKLDGEMLGNARAPTLANIFDNTNRIATTGWVQNLYGNVTVSLYAPKVDANLQGVPTAPTAANTTANSQIATTAFVQNLFGNVDLSPYATKVSPTLTGVPRAPTATSTDNSTQIATTNFVQLQKVSPAFTGTPTAPTAAQGTNTTQIATTEFVTTAVTALGPSTVTELAGSIKLWPSINPPDNWALCNGQAVSRSTYATLFAKIGTSYGSGDGSTTFNLPDFRDRFPVGAGTGYNAGSTGGFADAAVITHTHPTTSSFSINDSGHLHHGVLESAANPAGRRVTLNRAVGQNDNDATGGNLDDTTALATTGISISGSVSLSAPVGSVSGEGRNLPPYLGAYFIIKLSDDGSGGGTLQAGSGIDITTSGAYSTIRNTGVTQLIAGSGITLSASSGNVTISSGGGGGAGNLVAGTGIALTAQGSNTVISSTIAQTPVIAGPGTSVTNTPAGAVVSANVRSINSGTGISIENNGGNYTINSSIPASALSAWCSIAYDGFNQPYLAASYNMRLPITVQENPSDPPPQPGPPQGIGAVKFYTIPFVTPMVSTGYSATISFEPNYTAIGSGSTSRWFVYLPGANNVTPLLPFIWWRDTDYIILGIPPAIYQKQGVQSQSLALIHLHIAGGQ